MVYTGDYSGFVWKLNQVTKNDNSNAYYGGFKTAIQVLQNARVSKHFKRLWVVCESKGDYDLQVKWWLDGAEKTSGTVAMAGTGGILDAFTLDTDILGGNELISSPMDLGDIGKRIQFEIYDTVASQDFMISQLLIDYKTLGGEPS
jgi:hypothetical protein